MRRTRADAVAHPPRNRARAFVIATAHIKAIVPTGIARFDNQLVINERRLFKCVKCGRARMRDSLIACAAERRCRGCDYESVVGQFACSMHLYVALRYVQCECARVYCVRMSSFFNFKRCIVVDFTVMNVKYYTNRLCATPREISGGRLSFV